MAAEELSQERLFVAYDTQQQEDEHSCFSDTTHLDVYYNYIGIENVLNLFMNDLSAKNAALQSDIRARLQSLNVQTLTFRHLIKPFWTIRPKIYPLSTA